MIELVVIAFLGLMFIFAYLYANSPDSGTISGFIFRYLYLGVALFLGLSVLFFLRTGSETRVTTTSEWNGAAYILASQCNETITLSSATLGGVQGWLDAYSYIPYLVLTIITLFWLFTQLSNVMKRRKDKEMGNEI